MDPKLLDFIQKAKAASETDEEIRSSLASAGWESVEIDQAFASFQKNVDKLPTSTPSLPKINIIRANIGKFIVPVIVVFVLLVVGVTAGYVMLKSSPTDPTNVTNTPEATPSAVPENQPSVASVSPRVVSPTTMQGEPIMVNKVRNILAYTETPQSDKPPVLVFYDVVKKQKLPPDPVIEADKNYMIMLGPWSPDGQYLPILAYTGPASQESNINFYLFDSKTLHSKRIYGEPHTAENTVWASTSFTFTSGWIDNERLVMLDERDNQGKLEAVTYINTIGKVIKIDYSDEIRKQNSQLEYSFGVGASGLTIDSLRIGVRDFTPVPIGEIVGVVDEMLVVLNKPVPYDLMGSGGSGFGLNKETERLIEELQKLELPEEEVHARTLDLLEPKGDTVLKFYDLNDGVIKKEINLTDGTWQITSILVHPSKKTLIAHQIDKVMQTKKQRYIIIDLSSKSGFQTIFEEGVESQLNQPYLSLLMNQGISFLLSADGNSIIGMRSFSKEDPHNSSIYIKDMVSGREEIVCQSQCSDARIYYPYHLVMRF